MFLRVRPILTVKTLGLELAGYVNGLPDLSRPSYQHRQDPYSVSTVWGKSKKSSQINGNR